MYIKTQVTQSRGLPVRYIVMLARRGVAKETDKKTQSQMNYAALKNQNAVALES